MSENEKRRLWTRFNGNPPVHLSSIQHYERESGVCLPDDYSQFLQQMDGGEGFIGSAYLILWRMEELIEMNRAYHVSEYAPGLLLFGSDGGGEAFAFDMRAEITLIVSIPFIGMKLELVRPMAIRFTEFLEKLLNS